MDSTYVNVLPITDSGEREERKQPVSERFFGTEGGSPIALYVRHKSPKAMV
jgi:hypothetical protein